MGMADSHIRHQADMPLRRLISYALQTEIQRRVAQEKQYREIRHSLIKEIKEKRKPAASNQANGYILISSLVCLFLVLQLCTLCMLFIQQKSLLHAAQRQSTLDLSIYSQARKMAAASAYRRRCQSTQESVEPLSVTIDGVEVRFTDLETCIRAEYKKNDRAIVFDLFYTEEGTVSVKWYNSS